MSLVIVKMSSPASFASIWCISGLNWNTIGRRESAPKSDCRSAGSSRAALLMARLSGVSPARPISMSVAPYPLNTGRKLWCR